MRGAKQAAYDDRKTAWSLANEVLHDPSMSDEQVDQVKEWIDEGITPSHYMVSHRFAMRIVTELEAERNRTAAEVALVLGRGDDVKKGDHVRVEDPRSRHYGRGGIVWFIRDGRVMVSMADPRSIGGSVRDSFLPEHVAKLDEPAPINLERAVLLRFMRENADMNDNLSSTQDRCTLLLEATRSMRQKIVELGGEDPGPA